MEHSMTEAILKQVKNASFEEGVQYAMEYLSDLYDGIEETDLFAQYGNKENN